MTKNEVKRLATALANANGHDQAGDYADKVVAAWVEAGHPDEPDDEDENEGK